MQANRGFTLVELMVTIAVVAILAMIAAPSMSSMLAKQRLNSTTRDLAATLSQARSQAALLRREVTVTLNSTAAPTTTSFSWAPGRGSTYNTTSVTSIVFLPNGTIQNSANTCLGVCIVSNSSCSSSKKITISKMGTLSQEEGTC